MKRIRPERPDRTSPRSSWGAWRWEVLSDGGWGIGSWVPNTNIIRCSSVRVKAPCVGFMARLFGEKLRYLRRYREMTQSDLATALVLASHSHIANVEAGRDVPSLALVVRIATVFGVSTDYLLRDTIPVEGVELNASIAEALDDRTTLQLGSRLRALRLRQGMTQADVAEQLGLARRSYISNLEAGRKLPSLDLVVRLTDLLGVSTDELFIDPGSKSP
jgi:transcriptional regulator with XRE-family HTH domain